MNNESIKQLYNNLVQYQKLLYKRQELNKQLNALKSGRIRYGDVADLYKLNMHSYREYVSLFIIPGVFTVYFVLILIIGEIKALNPIFSKFEKITNLNKICHGIGNIISNAFNIKTIKGLDDITTFGYQILFLGIPFLIITVCVLAHNILVKAENNKARKLKEENIRFNDKGIDTINKRLIESFNQIIKIGVLHQNYINIDAVNSFLKYLQTGRAENLKECMNLYEKEIQESNLSSQIQSTNDYLDSVNARQSEIEEDLRGEYNRKNGFY